MTPPSDPSTTPNLPPQTNSSSDTWDPATVSNIIFSAIMVFIGIIAIWQAHSYRRRTSDALNLDEEEIIGIRVLSRTSTTSTTSSNSSAGLHPILPSSQEALTNPPNGEDQGDIEALTLDDRADTLDDMPVGAASSL